MKVTKLECKKDQEGNLYCRGIIKEGKKSFMTDVMMIPKGTKYREYSYQEGGKTKKTILPENMGNIIYPFQLETENNKSFVKEMKEKLKRHVKEQKKVWGNIK